MGGMGGMGGGNAHMFMTGATQSHMGGGFGGMGGGSGGQLGSLGLGNFNLPSSSFNAPDPKIKESFAKDGFKVSGIMMQTSKKQEDAPDEFKDLFSIGSQKIKDKEPGQMKK